MEKEIRILEDSGIQLREESEGDDKKYFAEGYALLFGIESKNLGGFTEMIESVALDGADVSDVVARTHHNDHYLLGRTKSGTLELKADKKGLWYSVELGDTSAARDLKEMLKRKDITESSFAFTIDYQNNGYEWIDRDDDNKIPLRKITKFKKIYDVSPVVVPAYEGTSVGVAKRDLQQFIDTKNSVKEDVAQKIKIEQEQKERTAKVMSLKATV